MVIRFIKPMPPYATGELANVSEKQARRLIKLGVAEVFKHEIKEEGKEEIKEEIKTEEAEETKQAVVQKDKMVRKSKVEK